MKKWLSQVTPLAVVASLALAGAARADFVCSNATLTGAYASSVTNLTVPQVVAVIEVLDGNGHFTQRDYSGGSVPAEFAPPGQETGTYTVNPDCTGSAVINLNVPGGGGTITILFVISNGGRHYSGVVAEIIPPFSTQPIHPVSSFEAWKVAPAENNQNNQ
jgi:hypothetical protein